MSDSQGQRVTMNVEGMTNKELEQVYGQALRAVTENDPQSEVSQYGLAVGAQVVEEQRSRR